MALYSVNLIGIPLSIVTSIVLTKYLGPAGFGNFSLLYNIFHFANVIFTFGFFHAANRALVLTHDEKRAREYYGASFINLIGLSILMGLSLTVYALLDGNLIQKGLDHIVIWSTPFSMVFLLTVYFETLFQADNKIFLLSLTRLLPKIGFFFSILIVFFVIKFGPSVRLVVVWSAYISVFILVYLFALNRLKINFSNFRIRFSELWNYSKSYGFHVYTGSIASVGFAQLAGVLISYFSQDNSGVGFFSLAVSFSTPLSFVPNVIATTHFKDFASRTRIPRKLFVVTAAISLFALLLLWILVGPFIRHFYGPRFLPVIKLNFIVSIGVIFYGLADLINRFLGAHGRGKALRNSSFIIGFSMLILNIGLIPRYGETGAAYTKIVSGVLYFGLMIRYYRKLVTELEKKS